MIRTATLTAAAAIALGLASGAQAQLSSQTQDNVGANAAGSKSGVVGKGDAMDGKPATTGTAIAPGSRMAPDDRAMPPTSEPSVAPRSTGEAPAR